VTPESPQSAVILDASGPDKPPVPRPDSSELSANGAWTNGRWQVVFSRPRQTQSPADIAFDEGSYIPIAFANWDGLAGEKGGRHSFTPWYWIQLEPGDDPLRLYGFPIFFGLLAGAAFLIAARSQRRKFRAS